MKKTLFFATFLGALQMAAAQTTLLQWVGQLPKEQAEPVVELFNSEYGPELGFFVEYKYDETAVTDLLAGKARPEFDVVHMKDADMLNNISKQSLTTAVQLEKKDVLLSHLKDPMNQWIGILKRARILYYNSDLVAAGDIQNYEDLALPQFVDKLCLRQKKAQYNIGLYSFFVGVWGAEKTRAILKGWADNSAILPLYEKDLDHVIANINSGTCAVGVANTYYYLRHIRAEPNSKVKAVMPNQQDVGVHVNIDGVAILKGGAHPSEAQAFINWLLSEAAQQELSRITGKFPTNPAVVNPELQALFGSFKENESFHLNQITDFKSQGLEIATEQGLK